VKDPLIFCMGSFGVFAPQDDEKNGLGIGFRPVNEPAPGLSLFDFSEPLSEATFVERLSLHWPNRTHA